MPQPISDLAPFIAAFETQADWCDRLGSPFNAALLRGLLPHIGTGGVLDRLLSSAPVRGHVAGTPLRVTGALHYLSMGDAPDLAALYPAATGGMASMDVVLPAALTALETHEAWATAFLHHAPQTNETRRSAALILGFSHVATGAPMHMLEVGASAGLNLNWDAFSYALGGVHHTGATGAPHIETDWTGPAPDLSNVFNVASRKGCDLNPVDLSDPETGKTLRAYIWPDQTQRLDRLGKAISIAAMRGAPVDRLGAADWLERELSPPLKPGITVIFHSIAWQYFDEGTHTRAMAAIEVAAARADTGHRLAWVRFEHAKVFGDAGTPYDSDAPYILDVQQWPQDSPQTPAPATVLAHVDPHVRWLRRV